MDNKPEDDFDDDIFNNKGQKYILIESSVPLYENEVNNDQPGFNLEFQEKWDKIESNLQRNINKKKLAFSSPQSFNQMNKSTSSSLKTIKQSDLNYLDIPSHYTQQRISDSYNSKAQPIQLAHFIHPYDTSFEDFSLKLISKLEQMKTVPYRISVNGDEDSTMLPYLNPRAIQGLPEYEELSPLHPKKTKGQFRSFLRKDNNEPRDKSKSKRRQGKNEREQDKRQAQRENNTKSNDNSSIGTRDSHFVVNAKDKRMDYFDQALKDSIKERKIRKAAPNSSKVIQKIEDNKLLLNALFKKPKS